MVHIATIPLHLLAHRRQEAHMVCQAVCREDMTAPTLKYVPQLEPIHHRRQATTIPLHHQCVLTAYQSMTVPGDTPNYARLLQAV